MYKLLLALMPIILYFRICYTKFNFCIQIRFARVGFTAIHLCISDGENVVIKKYKVIKF